MNVSSRFSTLPLRLSEWILVLENGCASAARILYATIDSLNERAEGQSQGQLQEG
jgi:hypothetical protein